MPSEVQPDAIVSAARSMIGTPYGHQGRVPGRRLDCVGLLICVANQVGLEDNFSFNNYARFALNDECRRWLASKTNLVPGGLQDARAGDIALFRDQKWATHTAWLAAHRIERYRTMIHAFASARCVVEHRLDSYWLERLVGVYRHPRTA